MAELNEYKWKSTKVQGAQAGNSSGGSGPMPLEKSYSWYKRIIENTGTREQKLQRFDQMDRESVEISRALDLIAEDISSMNADREDIFNVIYDDVDDVKKTTVKTLEYFKDLWEERTRFDKDFFHHVRDVLKNGTKFFIKQPDGSLKPLIDERVIGYVQDPKDESKVSHYLYDEGRSYRNEDNRLIQGSNNSTVKPIPVEDMVVLKIGTGAFGESILENVYSLWKKLQLLEDSIVIYRVIRAPERRVFYIDTGTMPEHKRDAVIEKYKLKLRQKKVLENGNVSSDFDPHSAVEDYFIPTSSSGRGSKVETLQGGGSSGSENLNDAKWFSRKLAAKLRIPFSMIDIHQEGSQDQYSDARVGQVYAEEVRYMGMVYRLQFQLIDPINEHFYEFCKYRDFEIPEGIELEVNTPNSFAEYKNLEINQARLNVYTSADNVEHLSKKFTLKKFMGLDDEEIMENENMALKEKGLDDNQIKKLSDTERSNIVYGDARLGEEYGISGNESGGRW